MFRSWTMCLQISTNEVWCHFTYYKCVYTFRRLLLGKPSLAYLVEGMAVHSNHLVGLSRLHLEFGCLFFFL
jgi:hypothetical protein